VNTDPLVGRSLYFNCGDCSTTLAPVPLMAHAALVVRRTCRRCKQRWQIVVEPLARPRKGIAIHSGTLTPIANHRSTP
jgi:hypothetical protein